MPYGLVNVIATYVLVIATYGQVHVMPKSGPSVMPKALHVMPKSGPSPLIKYHMMSPVEQIYVCMHARVCVCTCVCMHVYMYVCVCMHVCNYASLEPYVYVCVCMCATMQVPHDESSGVDIHFFVIVWIIEEDLWRHVPH